MENKVEKPYTADEIIEAIQRLDDLEFTRLVFEPPKNDNFEDPELKILAERVGMTPSDYIKSHDMISAEAQDILNENKYGKYTVGIRNGTIEKDEDFYKISNFIPMTLMTKDDAVVILRSFVPDGVFGQTNYDLEIPLRDGEVRYDEKSSIVKKQEVDEYDEFA